MSVEKRRKQSTKTKREFHCSTNKKRIRERECAQKKKRNGRNKDKKKCRLIIYEKEKKPIEGILIDYTMINLSVNK
jgi:hypothetical protein